MQEKNNNFFKNIMEKTRNFLTKYKEVITVFSILFGTGIIIQLLKTYWNTCNNTFANYFNIPKVFIISNAAIKLTIMEAIIVIGISIIIFLSFDKESENKKNSKFVLLLLLTIFEMFLIFKGTIWWMRLILSSLSGFLIYLFEKLIYNLFHSKIIQKGNSKLENKLNLILQDIEKNMGKPIALSICIGAILLILSFSMNVVIKSLIESSIQSTRTFYMIGENEVIIHTEPDYYIIQECEIDKEKNILIIDTSSYKKISNNDIKTAKQTFNNFEIKK